MFLFSSRRRHTRSLRDWSSDVCSSDLFAEALAQPADVELDTILRWCAKAREYPPTPDERGLDETTLTEVPGWLHGAYPELFEREHLRERLRFYDMQGELALYTHHPLPDIREAAQNRIARLLS